jgi:beta-phosphoglucomutase
MKYSGVIFDLDGVICFTDEYHYLSWKAIADKEGIYFDRIINNRLRGVSRMASLDIILEKANKTYSEQEKVALATEKNEIYKGYLVKMTPKDVSSDVLKTLKTLRAKGIKIAIGSSSKNTKLILKQIGLLDAFDEIADGNDITHSKPDPEVFLCAAKKIKEDPKDCIVVEDAYAGIDAANAGHFTSVAIGDAANYDKANYKIKKLSDILKIVK